MAITQRRMTLEEFLELPEIDEKPYLEFCDGVVTEKVSAKAKHSTLHDELIWRLNLVARPRRLARVYPELRTTFANASRVPDIAVYRRGRIPREPSGEVVDDFVDPPDIAIEIISPGQTVAAMTARCQWFVEHGVRIALLVRARNRTVLRFRPGLPAVTLRGTDRIDLDDVLPGFELTVQELFDSLIVD
jgi:Uma2 family endonuclease